jgi:hypothetical protein
MVLLTVFAAVRAGAYTVQATAGAGGSVSPAGVTAFANGADATFTVSPSNGFRIADVRINGESVGPVPRYTFAGPVSNQVLEAFFHVPWAAQVTAYTAGTNSFVQGTTQYRRPETALGEPTRRTSGGADDVTMFQPPWVTNEIVSVGSGGELVVAFDHPILDDPKNPYGVDLLVFGNSMFRLSSTSKASGISAEPGRVSVSQNGTDWVQVVAASADGLFPTLGYRNTTLAQYAHDGTLPTDFTLPVDPSVTWTNKTYSQLVSLYAGSGGGGGVDLAPTGLGWIKYVKVWQPLGQAWSTEVDALSDVAPSLRRTLTVHSAWQRCSPPEGSGVYTSGVPVACSVSAPLIASGVGTQVVCVGWSGTGSVPAAGTGTTTRFTIGTDSELTWRWETQVWLSVAAGTGGTVSVTGAWRTAGSTAMVTATPASGYRFAGWAGDVTGDATAAATGVVMDRKRTLSAHFEPVTLPAGVEAWLVVHGLTNGSPPDAAAADVDGDGLTALEEFLAGTDPTNPALVFRFIAVEAGVGSNRLVWLGGTGGSAQPFCVLGRESLTGAWSVLADDLAHSPTGTNVWWHVVPDNRPRFYRLRVAAAE